MNNVLYNETWFSIVLSPALLWVDAKHIPVSVSLGTTNWRVYWTQSFFINFITKGFYFVSLL
jgi:hypothetical protein